MKIVAIHSSLRPKSITSALLSEVLKYIQSSPKHSTEIYNVNTLNIKPCISCYNCRPDKKCILPHDDAHILAERIKQSDLLIIGAPTYWGNIPGTLKILFDRCVSTFEYAEAKVVLLPPKPLLKGKKALIITASASYFPFNLLLSQSRGTIQALKTILNAGGIKIIKIINVSNSYKFEKMKQKYFTKAKKLGLSINAMR